jgi:NADH-quinone oxidoreductase subunit E
MGRNKERRDALLGMIKEAQARSGFISEEAISDMAVSLGLCVSDVYGVATFYSFVSTRPLGRHIIRICKSVPCCMKEAETLARWIGKELGIGPGETTADGRFSFELTNCIGACDQAPAMLIDDEVYGRLTSERISEILTSYD